MHEVKKSSHKKIPWLLGYAVVFFMLAQISQHALKEPLLCNTGISFGLKLPPVMLFFGIAGAFFLLLFFLIKAESYFSPWKKSLFLGGGLFLGGALSNIFDRLTLGCVPDFFRVVFFFPAFNIADIGISCGAILFLISIVRK